MERGTGIRLAVVALTAASLAAGCSGDGPGPAVTPEVQPGDDVATQLLIRLYGFSDAVTVQERACMSDELAELFPGGTVPADIQLTEELAVAIDAAAETCEVVL